MTREETVIALGKEIRKIKETCEELIAMWEKEYQLQPGDIYDDWIVVEDRGDKVLVCIPPELEFSAPWDNARFIAKRLGGRLPTIDELNLMYRNLHKQGLGGFADYSYWSSSDKSFHYAWRQIFGDGYQGSGYKDDSKCVRAVREVKKEKEQ
jgi:hypothetical protein